MEKLSAQIMWQACRDNDASFDGRFYYGVRSTGIFCRPSCPSRLPRRENVVFFATAAAALQAGFRPCKRCRPELDQPFQPVQELIDRACQIMREEYASLDINSDIAARIGLSPFYFQRQFKKITGKTPGEYLKAIRLEQARRLLLTTGLEVTEIAFATGFNSLAGFYSAFKKLTGMSPGQFRSNYGEEN